MNTGIVDEGRTAYKNGVKVGDNPYPENDDRHWQWMKGWADAGMKALREKQLKT